MTTHLACALLGLAMVLSGTAHAAPRALEPLSPSTSEALAPAAVPGPAPQAEPRREHTALLLGDSLIATGFGRDLEQRLEEHPHIRAQRRARSSTGLARPDFFDWMQVGRQEVERHRPDLVIIIIGGNDGQGITDGEGKAVAFWGKPDWERTYRERMEAFLRVIAAPGRKILWLELPTTGLRRFEAKLALIRRVQREVLQAREDTHHLETRPFFTDARGRVLVSARVEGSRKPQRLRLADGVHFTVAGGRYFASKVYPEVLSLLGLGPQPEARPARAQGRRARADDSVR